MSQPDVLPELKQIVGALLFGAKDPVTVTQVRGVLQRVADTVGGATADFAEATAKDIREAVKALSDDLEKNKVGFHVVEVANGYRLENDSSCGSWLRDLLNKGRSQRLSRPALETLAIVAYRQPCTRGEVELVRGVAVDQMIRNLLEMGLVKVLGRSELPGRPWLFGTTQKFLEHFGLNDVRDLPNVDELRRREAAAARAAATEETAPAGDEPAPDEPEESEMNDEA